MTIQEIIAQREIIEVVHFTTHRGLLGTLHSGALKSRSRLPKEVDLKYIYKPNADTRKDVGWLDYVNLSISHINSAYFGSSCRWHREEDLWWCITAFDPVILTHPHVHFATTNNMYTGVIRLTGPEGLKRLFAQRIVRWNGNSVIRAAKSPANHPTCEFAEVLYPGEVSIEFLRKVYVECGEDQDEVYAQMHMIGVHGIDVVIDPARFGQRAR